MIGNIGFDKCHNGKQSSSLIHLPNKECPFRPAETGSISKSIERISASQCPFMHGTVSAGPYPGYIQGKDARVCPKGCTPQLHPTATETPLEALQREAEEFCMLYHSEKKLSDEVKDRRWSQILASIRATGTYELSSEELEHGAKVSWRNAPKCPNRSKWEELTVKDCRGITTNEEAFHNILDLFEESITSGATITRMAVFPAKGSNQVQGPRIWNGMLLRFAGYRLEDGTILGDPSDVEFTETLISQHGWEPPSPRSAWDPLPLLLQIDEQQPPELFSIPTQYLPIVSIKHKSWPKIDMLDLRWFGIPVVSGMLMNVGGLLFTMCPFVGWFMDMEVVRNLTDSGRYNQISAIAKAAELDTSSGNELWKDEAFLITNQAVVQSFRDAGVAMISHHTMLAEFYAWYKREMATRGYCPGNWKWIIPPTCSSLYDAYLGLNTMKEFTLKPAILPNKVGSWRNYKVCAAPTAVPSGPVSATPVAGNSASACPFHRPSVVDKDDQLLVLAIDSPTRLRYRNQHHKRCRCVNCAESAEEFNDSDSCGSANGDHEQKRCRVLSGAGNDSGSDGDSECEAETVRTLDTNDRNTFEEDAFVEYPKLAKVNSSSSSSVGTSMLSPTATSASELVVRTTDTLVSWTQSMLEAISLGQLQSPSASPMQCTPTKFLVSVEEASPSRSSVSAGSMPSNAHHRSPAVQRGRPTVASQLVFTAPPSSCSPSPCPGLSLASNAPLTRTALQNVLSTVPAAPAAVAAENKKKSFWGDSTVGNDTSTVLAARPTGLDVCIVDSVATTTPDVPDHDVVSLPPPICSDAVISSVAVLAPVAVAVGARVAPVLTATSILTDDSTPTVTSILTDDSTPTVVAKRTRDERPFMTIMFATVTGTSAAGAKRLYEIFSKIFRVSLVSINDWEPAVHVEMLRHSSVAVFLTSTYGSGAAPPEAGPFLEYLSRHVGGSKAAIVDAVEGHAPLNDLHLNLKYAIIGYGSSAYPRFCGSVDIFDDALTPFGQSIIPAGKIDSLRGSKSSFSGWLRDFIIALSEMPDLHDFVAGHITTLGTVLDENPEESMTVGYSMVQLIGSCRIHSSWPHSITGKIERVEPLFASSDANRSVFRVVIDYSHQPGARYSPGDIVALFPQHSEDRVRRAAKAFGLERRLQETFAFELDRATINDRASLLSEEIPPPPFPTPTTVHVALTKYLALEARPTFAQFMELAHYSQGALSEFSASLLPVEEVGGVVQAVSVDEDNDHIEQHGLRTGDSTAKPSHSSALKSSVHKFASAASPKKGPGGIKWVDEPSFTTPRSVPAAVTAAAAAATAAPEEGMQVASQRKLSRKAKSLPAQLFLSLLAEADDTMQRAHGAEAAPRADGDVHGSGDGDTSSVAQPTLSSAASFTSNRALLSKQMFNKEMAQLLELEVDLGIEYVYGCKAGDVVAPYTNEAASDKRIQLSAAGPTSSQAERKPLSHLDTSYTLTDESAAITCDADGNGDGEFSTLTVTGENSSQWTLTSDSAAATIDLAASADEDDEDDWGDSKLAELSSPSYPAESTGLAAGISREAPLEAPSPRTRNRKLLSSSGKLIMYSPVKAAIGRVSEAGSASGSPVRPVAPFPSPASVASSTASKSEASPKTSPAPSPFRFSKGKHKTTPTRRHAAPVFTVSSADIDTVFSEEVATATEEWFASEGIDWVRLFEYFPSLKNAPLSVLFQTINPVNPRYYSISSSERMCARKVELTVGLLSYKDKTGQQRTGICSGFLHSLCNQPDFNEPFSGSGLAGGMAEGAKAMGVESMREVDFRIIKVPSYHLPMSDSVPIICVSSGTGFAPFRGFIQERIKRLAEHKAHHRHRQEWGPCFLFHGCRTAEERLYPAELAEAVACGAITAVSYAYSRSQEHPKMYVQDLIRRLSLHSAATVESSVKATLGGGTVSSGTVSGDTVSGDTVSGDTASKAPSHPARCTFKGSVEPYLLQPPVTAASDVGTVIAEASHVAYSSTLIDRVRSTSTASPHPIVPSPAAAVMQQVPGSMTAAAVPTLLSLVCPTALSAVDPSLLPEMSSTTSVNTASLGGDLGGGLGCISSALTRGQIMAALAHPKACIYVCGDVGMAGDVEKAFEAVLGAAAMKSMRDGHRYREEIFGTRER